MTCPVIMKDTADVKRVNEVATQAHLDMYIRAGSRVIDPRSLLGLFTFIGKEAILVAPDSTDPKYFLSVIKKMNIAR